MTKQWNYWKPLDFFPYTLTTLMHECINLFLNGVFIKPPDNFVLHVWVLIYIIFATSGIFCNLCLKFGVKSLMTYKCQKSISQMTLKPLITLNFLMVEPTLKFYSTCVFTFIQVLLGQNFSSFLLGVGELEPIPAIIGWEAGCNLDRSSAWHRANTETWTRIHTDGLFRIIS